ncbi:MAG: OsmC family protein [Gammaproteobacteria bacterium]|mgnify:FL=1|jgi:uncharacterized OsmC-like protein|nr:OsmC family protein [Gammaproteobacteria bacterium]MDG2434417.1 OsmC family protein [Gammaproteobacteria bacterium]
MATSIVYYSGELRTESTHIQSGQKLTTDAPTDNEGKGKAFSPTDLLATSLANCMLTIMGITAQRKNINIDSTRATVEKIMGQEPRRVQEIKIDFQFPTNYTDKEKKLLEQAALTCPVANSLSKDLIQTIKFSY